MQFKSNKYEYIHTLMVCLDVYKSHVIVEFYCLYKYVLFHSFMLDPCYSGIILIRRSPNLFIFFSFQSSLMIGSDIPLDTYKRNANLLKNVGTCFVNHIMYSIASIISPIFLYLAVTAYKEAN